MTEDEIEAAIYGESIRGIMTLLDSAEDQIKLSNETIESLKQENAQLVDMLAAKGLDAGAIYKDGIPPYRASMDAVERLLDDVQSFHAIEKLPMVQEPKEVVNLDPLAQRLLRRY